MPEAARIGDFHECKKVNEGPNTSHVGGLISLRPGQLPRTVIIGNLPAAIIDDMCICVGPPATINQGSGSVYICGKKAARKNDKTDHLSTIKTGCSTVIIGD